MKRVIIFWDYSNFYSTIKELVHGDIAKLKTFDFQKFVQEITDGSDLIKVYFVCSKGENAEGIEKFFDWVDYQPFFYVKAFDRNVNPVTQESSEKQVDVYLATQIVALAYENAYDVAVLISGDQDFIPAIEIVQQKGKIVTVVSAEKNISPLLKKKADKTFLLNNQNDHLYYRNFIKPSSP